MPSGIFNAIEHLLSPGRTRRRAVRRPPSRPSLPANAKKTISNLKMDNAIKQLTKNLANHTRRMRHLRFAENNGRARGMKHKEVRYYNTVTPENIEHMQAIAEARIAPRWRRAENARGYYQFTNEVPKTHPGAIRLGPENSAIFAKLHRNSNSREDFLSALNQQVRNGKLSANASAKMLQKYNALYPVDPLMF